MPSLRPLPSNGVVVFDMDGVLVDVHASFRQAIVATVAALGGGVVSPDAIEELKLAGGFNNDWDLTRELLRQRGLLVALAAVRAAFDRVYLGEPGTAGLRLREQWLLEPALLERLRARYQLTIFTGRPRSDALYALHHFGVEACFSSVVALEDVESAKPAPEGLRKLAERFVPQPLVAYLGDTIDDARCSAAAGVPFLGIVAAGHARAYEMARAFRAAGCVAVEPSVTAAVLRLLAP